MTNYFFSKKEYKNFIKQNSFKEKDIQRVGGSDCRWICLHDLENFLDEQDTIRGVDSEIRSIVKRRLKKGDNYK